MRDGSNNDDIDDDNDSEMAEIDGRIHGLVEKFGNGGELAEEIKGPPESSRDEGLSSRNEITSTTPSCRCITRSMMIARQKEISLHSDSTSDDEMQQDRLEGDEKTIHNKSSLITDNTTARTTPTTDTNIDNSLHTSPSDDDTFPDFTDFNDPYIPTNDERGIPSPPSQPTKAVAAKRHPHSSSPHYIYFSCSEMELLVIPFTKKLEYFAPSNSQFLLGGFYRKPNCGFKTHYKKICETKKLESTVFMNSIL